VFFVILTYTGDGSKMFQYLQFINPST